MHKACTGPGWKRAMRQDWKPATNRLEGLQREFACRNIDYAGHPSNSPSSRELRAGVEMMEFQLSPWIPIVAIHGQHGAEPGNSSQNALAWSSLSEKRHHVNRV
jgi:hypothetical protein